jgi:glycosyltransferase involved in cell wall biosynthesis
MSSGTMVLLPAFNEAEHIAGVIDGVRKNASGADIVVIDDGSSDGTGERARSAGATVLRMPTNMGYGAALQTGYKYAKRMKAEYVVQLDADGQHNPAAIPRLIERVSRGDIDLCIGSRFLEGQSYAIPATRGAPA